MEADARLPEIHVQPGEACLIREPGILCTLLGSCVGLTFWVERLRVGGLCHPMLPAVPPRQAAKLNPGFKLRYVDFTIRDMAQQLDALGATRQETEVKVFGGADVLSVDDRTPRPTVGELNRETAIEVLGAEGYRVAASSLGGQVGIHIRFNTASGEVLLRRFSRTEKTRPAHRSRAARSEA